MPPIFTIVTIVNTTPCSIGKNLTTSRVQLHRPWALSQRSTRRKASPRRLRCSARPSLLLDARSQLSSHWMKMPVNTYALRLACSESERASSHDVLNLSEGSAGVSTPQEDLHAQRRPNYLAARRGSRYRSIGRPTLYKAKIYRMLWEA